MSSEKKRNKWVSIMITQMIAVFVITAAVLVIKYASRPTFLKIKAWYKENILNHTSISEVIK